METVILEKTIIKQLGESEDIHGTQIIWSALNYSHHFFICEIDGRDVEIGEAPKMCVALAESYMSIVYCICQWSKSENWFQGKWMRHLTDDGDDQVFC